MPAVARACGDGTPWGERRRAAGKSICKLNESGSGQTGAGGAAAAGEERVRKGNDRSEGGGEEAKRARAFDKHRSEADCRSEHVPRCYHPAHFLE